MPTSQATEARRSATNPADTCRLGWRMQVPPGLAGAAHDVLHTRDSALSQYDEEVIADRAQKRPTRRAPADPPQPFIKAWMPVSHPGQVWRRCKHVRAVKTAFTLKALKLVCADPD